MLVNLDPNPTYHISTEFPEKAVLVLFGNVAFSIEKEEIVPSLKQAVDTFLSLGIRDFLFYYHRLAKPDGVRRLVFKALFDMKAEGADFNIWYAYSERGGCCTPQMISHFSGIFDFPEHSEEITFLPVPDSSSEKLLHETLFQAAAGVICTYSLGRMPRSLASNIAKKKNIPVINIYLNTLLEFRTNTNNDIPEYKTILSTIRKLTQPGCREYTKDECLTQRAQLIGELDRLVDVMKQQKEKECLLLEQRIRELEKMLIIYQNP